MNKGRLEAFSDGVLAVIITIMVLEMKSPNGTSLAALRPVIPVLLTYVLSFVCDRLDGGESFRFVAGRCVRDRAAVGGYCIFHPHKGSH